MREFYIIEDRAAGELWVESLDSTDWWSNDNPEGITEQQFCGSYGNIAAGPFPSHEAAREMLAKWERETTIFAVFEDRASGESFVSEENCSSGNWKGSKYGHYTCVAEFKTREEAEAYIR